MIGLRKKVNKPYKINRERRLSPIVYQRIFFSLFAIKIIEYSPTESKEDFIWTK